MAPIRILQVVPNMQAGGLESFIMNIYRHIDRSKVQFDFLMHYQKQCFFDEEIERLGGKIYRLSVREDNRVFKYIRDLNLFFREHPEYRVVHGHMPSLSMFYLGAAKRHGVKVRIIHSHSDSFDWTLKGIIKNILIKTAKYYANVYLSCSESAGRYLYGNRPFIVVNNAINLQNFQFSPDVRAETRKNLGISNRLVIGHVGRFTIEKNQTFLVEIFSEIHKTNPNSVLLLIGDGPLRMRVEEKVERLGLQNDVMFLGTRRDVNRLYQAMDVFVLPSLFEGLPVVGVEAQTAGLPCVFSDAVTKEAKMTNLVAFEPLTHSAKEWADRILSQSAPKERKDNSGDIIKAGYDIGTVAKKMEDFYLEKYQSDGDL